jgi:hypothetical protein
MCALEPAPLLKTGRRDFVATSMFACGTLAVIPPALTNVRYGGKADMMRTGRLCPLMTQSGHRSGQSTCFEPPCGWPEPAAVFLPFDLRVGCLTRHEDVQVLKPLRDP